jgi:hypothetical protein
VGYKFHQQATDEVGATSSSGREKRGWKRGGRSWRGLVAIGVTWVKKC